MERADKNKDAVLTFDEFCVVVIIIVKICLMVYIFLIFVYEHRFAQNAAETSFYETFFIK